MFLYVVLFILYYCDNAKMSLFKFVKNSQFSIATNLCAIALRMKQVDTWNHLLYRIHIIDLNNSNMTFSPNRAALGHTTIPRSSQSSGTCDLQNQRWLPHIVNLCILKWIWNQKTLIAFSVYIPDFIVHIWSVDIIPIIPINLSSKCLWSYRSLLFFSPTPPTICQRATFYPC